MAACATCRFDPDHYTRQDLDGTVRTLALRWQWTVEGLDAAPVVALGDRVGAVATAGSCRPDELHEAVHALHEASRALAPQRAGAGATGSVAGLFTSAGGVPKRPVAGAAIGVRGVKGDRQAARQHHGRAWQALCLWSADRVEALAADGHPISPGNCGENISVRGIDWDLVRPGVLLAIGPAVVAEVSAFSTPCTKNARWFRDRDFNRIDHGRHPGWSRVYASVLADGQVTTGDQVVVEPS